MLNVQHIQIESVHFVVLKMEKKNIRLKIRFHKVDEQIEKKKKKEAEYVERVA